MTSSTCSGPDAAAGARAARDRVRRGHERVAAVVEVEQRALGPLEQHVVAAPQRVLDEPGGVVEVRRQPGAPGRRLLDQRVDREARGAHGVEQQVLVGQRAADPLAQDLAVAQVLHPQPEPPGAVAVGGPDPAPRRAHLRAAQPDLVGPVEGHVVRHDHVRAAADPDPRDVDALRRQHVELGDERGRVDDDAVADHRRDVRVEHARRAQLELERLVAHDDGVARVVAALVADDDGDVLGEEVGGLALALVAPLEAHDHGRGHQRGPDTKEPRTGPGSWIHVSRDSPRAFRRAGGSKVRARLTGRTPRLPRAMVISSIAGLAPRGLEDGPEYTEPAPPRMDAAGPIPRRARLGGAAARLSRAPALRLLVSRAVRRFRAPVRGARGAAARLAFTTADPPPGCSAGAQITGSGARNRSVARRACRTTVSTAAVHAGRARIGAGGRRGRQPRPISGREAALARVRRARRS